MNKTLLTALGTSLLSTFGYAAPCQLQSPPDISVVPLVSSGLPYTLSWDGDPSTTEFLVEEWYGEPPVITPFPASNALILTIPGKPASEWYGYRIANRCSGTTGTFSRFSGVNVVGRPDTLTGTETVRLYIPVGSGSTAQSYLVEGFTNAAHVDDTFTAVLDAASPGISVFPPIGALSAGGTSIQVIAHPSAMVPGRSRATMIVTRFNNGVAAPAVHVPVEITRVSPVSLGSRAPQPPVQSLLFPAVANAAGQDSYFQSDVRLFNAGESDVEAELAFTPLGSTAIAPQTVKRGRITVPAGATIALDDVVIDTFGTGPWFQGIGSMHVTPLSGSLVGSSRTYNLTPQGTLGQIVPALGTDAFVTKASARAISLQQLASNSRYRTNLGFVEGSGTDVNIAVRLVGADGVERGAVALSLQPFEVRQLPLRHSTLFPGQTFDDARVEVTVTSDTGSVTAYASVLDEKTSDPFFVDPVQPSGVNARRYTLTGMAEISTGRNFHSDMRVFNAGQQSETVTLAFSPFSGVSPVAPVTRTVAAGEVLVLDDVLPSLWNLDGTAGAVVATTAADSSLVITGRTFSRGSEGTYGQFISAMTPADGIVAGDAPMHVLQLEQSANFRSNFGVVEVGGEHGATLELTGWSAFSTPLATRTFDVGPGQSRQISNIFTFLGIPVVYNGRVSMKVLSGGGRVVPYGSVIDSRTEDPTYVPGQ